MAVGPDWDDEIARLLQITSGRELPGMREHLTAVYADVPLHHGTTTPVAQAEFVSHPSGLSVPRTATYGPLDHIGVLISTEDYLPSPPGADPRAYRLAIKRTMLDSATRFDLLASLSMLSFMAGDEKKTAALIAGVTDLMPPRTADRVRSLPEDRAFLARQPLLAAMKCVLAEGGDDPTHPIRVPVVAALCIAHALSADFGTQLEITEETATVLGNPVVRELVCNQVFYAPQDPNALLDRCWRLWSTYGIEARRYLDGRDAESLLESAVGLELSDLLSLGMSLYGIAITWEPGKAVVADPLVFWSSVDAAVVSRFLEACSFTVEEGAAWACSSSGEWDYLLFQERPLLTIGGQLITVDPVLLLARVTSGLYWWVHDHLKNREGDSARRRWTQAWGSMIERLVEDSLRPMAPVLLGEGTTYFTEEDLERAYPGDKQKRSDVLIDFGDSMVAFEIVAGQLSVPTRVEGDQAALARDLERLAFKKARQLDGTARAVLQDPAALTGVSSGTRPSFYPAIVSASGIPVSPATMHLVRQYAEGEGLFKHARIKPLVLLDLSEVEMLEGLVERGESLTTILDRWMASDLDSMPLSIFLHRFFADDKSRLRPARIGSAVQETLRTLLARFAPPPDGVSET